MNTKSFYIVFASALLILCSICFNGSYAYFLATVDTSGNVASSLTTDELNDIVLTGTEIKSSSNLIPGESVSTTFTVENSNKVDVCFDLEWSQVVNTFVNNDDLVVTLEDSTGKVLVSGLTFPTNDTSLITGLKVKAKTINTYTLKVLYKNTNKSQNDDMNKSFKGTISGVLKECQATMADYITTLAKTDTTNLVTDDYGNTRYVGSDPDNYISVDGEVWRVIGVMKDIDDGTGNKEDRVKIVRNESIGSYAWDTSDSSVNDGYGVNEWNQADVMKLLNPGYESESVGGSLYWNSGSGNCYKNSGNGTTSCDFTSTGIKNSLKNLIDSVKWNLGTNDGKTYVYNNILTSKFYEFERGTNNGKICTSGTYCTDTITRATTWMGNIGLIYPSDYGYATSGGTTTNRATCLNTVLYKWDDSSLSDCKNNDWLYNGTDQWTMLPYANSAYNNRLFIIRSAGFMGHFNACDGDGGVRPAAYLQSSVSIVSGTGSKTNPFILSA